MLSRFSKLPGISSLLSTNQIYPREAIDSAVAEIKKLGHNSTNNNEHTLQSITKILTLMKKFAESIHVQRVACHALSNLAMQVVIARWIVQKGGFQLIKKALSKFETDHKLCWLASSAVWNLARPPANRSIIGKDGVKIMLRMLSLHHLKEKVTNTSIGALSNLSLDLGLKDIIARRENIDIILHVLKYYSKRASLSVMTSGAGLIANLGVSDLHASTLVQQNCLPILLQLLEWPNSYNSDSSEGNSNSNINTEVGLNDTLYRNTCAALNNMVTADSFLESFLCSCGVETIFDFLQKNNNVLYASLLDNCLVNVEVDTLSRTTSMHLCCLHGRLNILKSLCEKFPFTDLDATDAKNMSCLDYAMSMSHMPVIEFLAKCGAIKYQHNLLTQTNNNNSSTQNSTSSSSIEMMHVHTTNNLTASNDNANNTINNSNNNHNNQMEEVVQALENGRDTLSVVRDANLEAICESLPNMAKDLCKLIVNCSSNIDMLKGMEQYY